MPGVDRECITHHMACDCREALYVERVRALEAERDALAARVAEVKQGLKYAEELSAHDKRCRDLAQTRVGVLEEALGRAHKYESERWHTRGCTRTGSGCWVEDDFALLAATGKAEEGKANG